MSRQVPIKFVGPAYLNVDPLSLAQGASLLVDGYVDEQGSLCKRPGIADWKSISHGTSATFRGMHWWVEQQRLIAVVGDAVYELTGKDGSFSKVSGAVSVDGSDPVVFDTNGVWLYLTGGGHVYRYNKTTFVQETDAACPTSSSHVGYLDGYMVANQKGTQLWSWAEPGALSTDPLVWSASSLSAESNPDPIQAIKVGWRELYLIGSRTVDVFVNDGNELSVFARLDGASSEKGCIAPYSVQKIDNSLIWMDDTKRIVQLKGDRTPVHISQPFDKLISNMASPYDARSTIIDCGTRKFYLLQFPTDERSFALDLSSGQWAEWARWNSSTEAYSRYLGEYSVMIPEWGGLRLITSRIASTNPRIYVLSTGFFNDAGDKIMMRYRTNSMNYGHSKQKRSNILIIRAKRGESDTVDSTGMFTNLGIPFAPDPSGDDPIPEFGGPTDEVVPPAPPVAGTPLITETWTGTIAAGATEEFPFDTADTKEYFFWYMSVDTAAEQQYSVDIADTVTSTIHYEYINIVGDFSDNSPFLFTSEGNDAIRITNNGASSMTVNLILKYSEAVAI